MEEKNRKGQKAKPAPNEDEECNDSKSKELPHGEDQPPGPRGGCEKESTVQGSE
jgi:hypothetical protein